MTISAAPDGLLEAAEHGAALEDVSLLLQPHRHGLTLHVTQDVIPVDSVCR